MPIAKVAGSALRCRKSLAVRACPTRCMRPSGEYTSAANMSLMMYPGLTQGAIAAILVHGSDEQKQTYLPKMVEGKWSGTMNLTEPHCGTDLGLLRTKAVPNGDGTYKISGQKIFISAGETRHDGQYRHLVLARIEGAPAGTKGISCSSCRNTSSTKTAAHSVIATRLCAALSSQDGHPRQCHLCDEL